MLYKEDWEKAKERLEALWENEIIDRCCISVIAPKNGSNYTESVMPEKYEDLITYYTDPEAILERKIKRFENMYFGGEAIPCIMTSIGTAGHAAYTEHCNYKFAPDTVWFFPAIDDWEHKPVKFKPQSEALSIQKKAMKFLSEEGKGKFFVSMPDNCGSIDALGHLRGSDNLLVDMVEEPETVKSSIKTMVEILKNAGDDLFEIIRENNDNGSTHGWMHTWSKGKHAQLQCDLSVMISPKMYEEFVLPELEETAAWLEHATYHLDGMEQVKHLDMILSVKKINMIQWTPVAGQPHTTEFIPILKKIQAAGKGLVLLPEIWEVEKLLSELSPKGLYLIVRTARSESEAKELIKKVSHLTSAS